MTVALLSGFATIFPNTVIGQSAPAKAFIPEAPAKEQGRLPSMTQPTHPLTATDLKSWLDGMLPAALKQGDVAGVVVSVVQDGHVLVTKGYGYADVARKTPMDPNRTLVRPGSTSKLFTWTAVMQLVQEGKLDLSADVNRYLDFKVPEPYGRPITLNDIMTHRAGFEEGLKDAEVPNPSQLQPLGVFLKRHVRPVLFPPGEVPAYSNYGAALAGYIVQRVSGENFDDYVAHHIFAQLRMQRSTFKQPLPPLPDSEMSKGYMSAAEPPKPFELISFAPAGSMTTTASDMTAFMLAQLQDGRLENAQILSPEATQLMHSPSLVGPLGFDVMAHGFFRDQRNGQVVLEHGGDSIFFHSNLMLLPQAKVGLFVSFNSRGRGEAVYGMRERLIGGFMDRYFPGPPTITPPALATAKADAPRIVGRYETSRRVQTGFMSLFYVLTGQETINANPDGTIGLSSAPGQTFREVAPDRWQQVGGARLLVLLKRLGVPTIEDSRDPVGVLQRTPLRRNATVNLLAFTLSFLVLIGSAVAWAVAEGARRAYRQPPALARRALIIRRLARIAVVGDIAYLLAWFVILKPILGNEVWFYTTALDPVIRTLQIAALVPLFGAAAGVGNAWQSLRSSRSWIIKIGSVVGAAALIGVVWIAYVGGLASFRLNY